MTEMMLPTDIASRLGVSERTVFNYRKKRKGEVQEEKRGGRVYVDFHHFSELFRKFGSIDNQSIAPTQTKPVYHNQNTIQQASEANAENSELDSIKEEKSRLESQNRNLESQAQKFALALQEEKSEKKELRNRYEKLEEKYQNKSDAFSRFRGNSYLAIALLLGLLVAVSTILFFLKL